MNYPKIDDEDFQYDIYRKREFHISKSSKKKDFKDYQDLEDYRNDICSGASLTRNHQSIISNFINPQTPYKGLFIFHGVGTGKTLSAIKSAERFRESVKKYNTKIVIIVPNTIIKVNWENEIMKHSKNYNTIKDVKQYYYIVSLKSFAKKVIGERLIDKERSQKEGKTVYFKNKNGTYERVFPKKRLEEISNSLIIIDEAHNLASSHKMALRKILNNSVNTKLLFLSATPMSNSALDIIDLINFLRPKNDKIIKHKVFTSTRIVSETKFKEGGKEYFEKMIKGYFSYYRGGDKVLFGKQVDQGKIPSELIYTPVIKVQMNKYQVLASKFINREKEFLNKKDSNISNYIIPVLSKNENDNKLYAGFGSSGINRYKNIYQNKRYIEILNKDPLVKEKIKKLDIKRETINGDILLEKNCQIVSPKLKRLYEDLKNSEGISFIYSSLVIFGTNIISNFLEMNGYLEYLSNKKHLKNINDYTKCSICKGYKIDHQNKNHKFYPLTFLLLTGSSGGESNESKLNSDGMQREKYQIINEIYNDISNKDGRNIDVLIGSSVMTEGITLKNVKNVFIYDVQFNLSNIYQIIGRAIRQCSHIKISSKENPYPTINVFRYISYNKNFSPDIDMYRRGELKLILIKKIERIIAKNAIDCALNNAENNKNMDFEGKCLTYEEYMDKKNKKILKKNDKICPEKCHFEKCFYKCNNKRLNMEYYDSKKKIYKNISREDLDYKTFYKNNIESEINEIKRYIKDFFIIYDYGSLEEIIEFVKDRYPDEKIKFFDQYFVFKALDKLIIEDINDRINYKDSLVNKFSEEGYLKYHNKKYIFKSFDYENIKVNDIQYYYDKIYDNQIKFSKSLKQWVKNNYQIDKKDNIKYKFENTMRYYLSKDEFDYVGTIDNINKSLNPNDNTYVDVFKIRKKIDKSLTKKRGPGILSFKGGVCHNSKDKQELLKILSSLKNKEIKNIKGRENICNLIMEELKEREKYSTGKNKKLYLMVPQNHPDYPFPYNLEDRVEYIKKRENIINVEKKGTSQDKNLKFILTKENGKKITVS